MPEIAFCYGNAHYPSLHRPSGMHSHVKSLVFWGVGAIQTILLFSPYVLFITPSILPNSDPKRFTLISPVLFS